MNDELYRKIRQLMQEAFQRELDEFDKQFGKESERHVTVERQIPLMTTGRPRRTSRQRVRRRGGPNNVVRPAIIKAAEALAGEFTQSELMAYLHKHDRAIWGRLHSRRSCSASLSTMLKKGFLTRRTDETGSNIYKLITKEKV